MSERAVVSVPRDRLDDLQSVWRALYEHHTALTPHLRDREVPFEQAWQSRREIEGGWFASEPDPGAEGYDALADLVLADGWLDWLRGDMR